MEFLTSTPTRCRTALQKTPSSFQQKIHSIFQILTTIVLLDTLTIISLIMLNLHSQTTPVIPQTTEPIFQVHMECLRTSYQEHTLIRISQSIKSMQTLICKLIPKKILELDHSNKPRKSLPQPREPPVYMKRRRWSLMSQSSLMLLLVEE